MPTPPGPVARLTAASLRHPVPFLAAALAVAAAGVWLASGLEIRSSFEELLPSDVPSVRHARELARRVGGDGTVLVQVESLAGPSGLPAAEAMAARLGDEYRALGPKVVRSVEVNLRATEAWYADHWPLFVPLAEIREARDRLVAAIGQAKARANPLLDVLGEEDAEAAPIGRIEVKDPLLDPTRPGPREEVAKRFARYRDGYLVHPDGASVTVVVRPTGTSLGVAEARALLDRMRAVADGHRAELERDRLRVGFAGTFPILLAEYEAILRDVASTFALVLALILVSIVLFYREVRPVLALGGAILVAVAATFGVTRLVLGYLNTQTAFLGSIVAGNGINYGLIYLARVVQVRRGGTPLEAACQEGARAAARATLLAAVGTSVSYGTLLVATNRGFRDFGFIGGMGMLLCWGFTFALVPAFLVVMERIRPSRPQPARPPGRWAGVLLQRLFARPGLAVAAWTALVVAAAAAFVAHLPDAMERNLDNLTNEVKGNPELRRDNDRAQAALGASIAGAVALLPSPEAAREYCRAVLRRVAERPGLRDVVDGCETISSVVPDDQPEKLALLRDVSDRLTPRVLAALPPEQAGRARLIRADLAAQKPVTAAEAPPSLVDRFREADGSVGRVAFVRAGSHAKLELAPRLRAFVDTIRGVPAAGGLWDAAGEQVVISDLLANIEREGPRTTLLSFGAVCLLVALFFRTPRQTALLVGSLTAGVVLMGGIAAVTGLKINFFNFIVYPITFGIAVDYGANVVTRTNDRGSVLPALAEVGPAVILCSWTTIVGYGSLVLSLNRALRSFGWYAMLGEFTTLATALMLLPALVLALKLAPAAGEASREG